MEHIKQAIKNLGTPTEITHKVINQEITRGGNTDTWLNPDCQICGGLGSVHPIINGVVDYSQTIPCSCIKDILAIRRKESLLKYCELPPMVEDMTFENFKVYQEVKEAFEVAKSIAENPNKLTWVVFMGLNDTGKTHLAISICKAWIEQCVAAKYAFVPLLLDELREGYRKNKDEQMVDNYDIRFKRLCNVPLLVLDDLGAENSSSWVQEKLEALVDYRYMNKLSLVVTTNKTIDEMSPRLGSRLVRHPNAKLVAIRASEYTMRRTKK